MPLLLFYRSISLWKFSFLQINNSFAGQNYFPYSAALLTRLYFKTFSSASDEYNFKPFIYKEYRSNLLTSCEGSNIIVLSLYAWNTRLSLAFAKSL